jgi:ribosomal protein L9
MEIKTKEVLKRIGDLEREIEYIKRDLLHLEVKPKRKLSLFGSVRGGDITDEMIEKAKADLFRELEDV